MENKKYILRLAPFYVAPDGTVLWPKIMNCGCKVEKVIDRTDEQFNLLIVSCDIHYDDIMRKLNFDSDSMPHKLFKFIDNESLPIVTPGDIE